MFSYPFARIGANALTTSLFRPRLSLNTIITNLEKTVSTINQVVPLYSQVKPLFTTSKGIIGALTKKVKTPQKKDSSNNVIDVNVVKPDYTTPSKETITKPEIFNNQTMPNKPFFNLA